MFDKASVGFWIFWSAIGILFGVFAVVSLSSEALSTLWRIVVFSAGVLSVLWFVLWVTE